MNRRRATTVLEYLLAAVLVSLLGLQNPPRPAGFADDAPASAAPESAPAGPRGAPPVAAAPEKIERPHTSAEHESALHGLHAAASAPEIAALPRASAAPGSAPSAAVDASRESASPERTATSESGWARESHPSPAVRIAGAHRARDRRDPRVAPPRASTPADPALDAGPERAGARTIASPSPAAEPLDVRSPEAAPPAAATTGGIVATPEPAGAPRGAGPGLSTSVSVDVGAGNAGALPLELPGSAVASPSAAPSAAEPVSPFALVPIPAPLASLAPPPQPARADQQENGEAGWAVPGSHGKATPLTAPPPPDLGPVAAVHSVEPATPPAVTAAPEASVSPAASASLETPASPAASAIPESPVSPAAAMPESAAPHPSPATPERPASPIVRATPESAAAPAVPTAPGSPSPSAPDLPRPPPAISKTIDSSKGDGAAGASARPAAPPPSGPDALDPALVGTWESRFASDQGEWVWTWVIEANGKFRWSSHGPIPLPDESGRLFASEGRFTRNSDDGRVDMGTYGLKGNALTLRSPAFEQHWLRK